MSIITITHFDVKCDVCGRIASDDDAPIRPTVADARADASLEEWVFADGKDWCPVCLDDAMTVASMPDGDLTGRDWEETE